MARPGADHNGDLLGLAQRSDLAFRYGNQDFLFFRTGDAQHRLAGSDHLAGIGEDGSDDAWKVGAQTTVIGLVAADAVLGPRLFEMSLSGIERVLAGIEGGLADELAFEQAGIAIAFGACRRDLAFGGGQLGGRGAGGKFQILRVETRQQLSGTDFATGIHQARLYLAADPESQFHLVPRTDLANQLRALVWCGCGCLHHDGAYFFCALRGFAASAQTSHHGEQQNAGGANGDGHGAYGKRSSGMIMNSGSLMQASRSGEGRGAWA